MRYVLVGATERKRTFLSPLLPRQEVPERHEASDTQTAGEVSCCASLLLQS